MKSGAFYYVRIQERSKVKSYFTAGYFNHYVIVPKHPPQNVFVLLFTSATTLNALTVEMNSIAHLTTMRGFHLSLCYFETIFGCGFRDYLRNQW